MIPADLLEPSAVADLNRLLDDNLALVAVALGALVVLLTIVVLVQGIRLGRAVRAYRRLVGDGAGGSLQQVLDEHIGTVAAVGRRLDEIQAVHELMERRTLTSLQHIGMVRFNPFEDTGSDQSFAIAMLDDRRDGIVLSSLHGRANTRIFAKPVENGGSSHNLSDEEARAIRIAVDGTVDQPPPP